MLTMRTGGAGLLIPGVEIIQAGGSDLTFLLRDDFTTNAAAPLTSPRTAEPGPGTLTITDTNNALSISSSKLVFGGNTGAFQYNPSLYGGGLSRVTGRALVATINKPSGDSIVTGWNSSASGRPQQAAVLLFSSNAIYAEVDGTEFLLDSHFTTTSVDITVACVLRTTGSLIFAKITGTWRLIWVATTSSGATVYPGASAYQTNTTGTLDSSRVLDLAAPFDTDYGLATQRTASPIANDTITSEANAVVEFTWTAVTSETVELSVRRTTDSDRWIVRGDQGGSTVKLIEVVAGVETERGSAAQTWTNTTSYRIVVVQDGTVMRVYVANVLKITYSSASSNQSATGVKTNKAGTNLVAWPRTLGAAPAALLDAAIA